MEWIIARIEPKNQRGDRMVLHFENEEQESLEISTEVFAVSGLGRGDCVSAGKLEELRREDERHRCRARAWSLLARRPRSRLELGRLLRQRRFSKAIVEETLDRLEAAGHLDDAEYARLTVEQARSAGKSGPRLVRQKLAQRGVKGREADEALAPLEDRAEQEEIARALLEKWSRRTRPAEPAKRRQSAAAFLLRRGFDNDVVWETVREVLGGEDSI